MLTQPLTIHPIAMRLGQQKRRPVQLMKCVLQHRSIDDGAKFFVHMHACRLRLDGNQVEIERSMMDATKTQAIGHDRVAKVFCVGDDVGGIQERSNGQTAHRALLSIRIKNRVTESRLV